MPASILEIRNLNIRFRQGKGYFHAVRDFCLDIERKQSVGMIGESGSGKSVTALAMLKLLQSPPAIITAERMAFIDAYGIETSLINTPDRQIRRIRGNSISMIFQEPMSSLNPVIPCGKQVAEAIRIHQTVSSKEAKARTIELFSEVRLPRPLEMFRSYAHELSGGQKQRIMIAMAVASGPDLLIADEPTSALDVTVQQSIIRLLRDLQQKYGMALLFITHDLGLASEISDKILVMNQGRIMESGTPDQVFRHPRNAYTRGLIACRPSMKLSLKRLPTLADFMVSGQENPTPHLLSSLMRNPDEYRQFLSKIYAERPVFRAFNIKTYFSSRRRISRNRDFIKAVDDVSLEIFPGEVFGLVGESGCGKTTLGRTILHLARLSAGRIFYKESDITYLKGKDLRMLRKEVQIIHQDPYSSLNPRLTAGSAVMEPMRVHRIGTDRKERRELAMQLLEKVGLERQHFHRYPHELSGGQRQRLCIARALAVKPRFIVCDESVSALDVSVQAQILNLLADLKDEFGLTIVFISHDFSVVKFLSDRIAVMKDGRIIETGTAEKIFETPENEYTRQMIAAIPGRI